MYVTSVSLRAIPRTTVIQFILTTSVGFDLDELNIGHWGNIIGV